METIPYFDLKNGVLKQLPVAEIAKMYDSVNERPFNLGLQLGAIYHLTSLLVKKPVTKRTIKKDTNDGTRKKKVDPNTRNTRKN